MDDYWETATETGEQPARQSRAEQMNQARAAAAEAIVTVDEPAATAETGPSGRGGARDAWDDSGTGERRLAGTEPLRLDGPGGTQANELCVAEEERQGEGEDDAKTSTLRNVQLGDEPSLSQTDGRRDDVA